MISPLRLIYLALFVWGTIHPMVWFIRHMRDTGTGLRGLIEAWFTNASTTGLVLDVTIAAIATIVWIVAETRVRRNWTALVAIPFIICIGLSSGLPLYLLLRTRAVT